MAWTGSTTWKYTTASTEMVTLSLVITAWGGMSTTSTRRVTLTRRSTIGNRKITPGPLASGRTWPRRKNTDRSYSVTTLMADDKKTMATKTTATTPTMTPTSAPDVARTGPTSDSMPAVSRLVARPARRPPPAGTCHDRISPD